MLLEPKLQPLINKLEPMKLNIGAKRAFTKTGCDKEKERQYRSYVLDTSVNEKIKRPVNIGMPGVRGNTQLSIPVTPKDGQKMIDGGNQKIAKLTNNSRNKECHTIAF